MRATDEPGEHPQLLHGATQIVRVLRENADPVRAEASTRFFKCGRGEYGEGDRFLGLSVPRLRALLRRCAPLPLPECERLLASPWHEARLLALLIMVRDYRRSEDPAHRQALHECYLANTRRVNNWDLVDSSAEHLVGAHLAPKGRALLDRLARSHSLWERRIAMLATHAYIKRGEAVDALRIAQALLDDEHDLIHKAVGWMLREIGQRCAPRILIDFLERHSPRMPRTALRYAIERLPDAQRRRFLARPRQTSTPSRHAPKRD